MSIPKAVRVLAWACSPLTLSLALGFVISCSPSSESSPQPVELRVDLVKQLGIADVRGTRSRLRLAEPSARSHLVSGFSFLEQDDSGGYIWAIGDFSEIEIFLVEPKAFELVVHGRPFQPEGAPSQNVTLELNGKKVGSIALDRSADRIRFSVPAGHTQEGRNVIGLRFSAPTSPAQWSETNRDDRLLAFQIYSLEYLGLKDSEPPERLPGVERAGVDSRDESAGYFMELPTGSRVSWFVDAHRGEVLALEPVATGESGEANADLEIFAVVSDSNGRKHERLFAANQGVYIDLNALFFTEAMDTQSDDIVLEIELLSRQRRSLSRRLQFWRGEDSATPSARISLRGGVGSVSGEAPALEQRSSAPAEDPAGNGSQSDESVSGAQVSRAQVSADPAPSTDPLPDILIYMVDTLRADRLGVYGSDLGLTPNFDRFADDAVVFRQSRAQTSWTRTAVTSLMTGLYPQSHGVNGRDDGLSQAVETLAEALGEVGYHNVGVVSNGNVGGRFGLNQGFDVYQHLRESRHRRDVHILSDKVNDWLTLWLTTQGPEPATRDRAQKPPFFLYAHVTDPHAPYTPHEPYLSRFASEARPDLGLLDSVRAIDNKQADAGVQEARELLALYNAEVAFTDEHFGHLMTHLKDLGLYDSMMIMVVSDHGEEFFEHGDWEHGETLYEEQLRVPLIIKLPANEGRGQVLDVRAGHVDVMPTFLEVVGAGVSEGRDGKSLLPSIRGLDEQGGAATLAYLALEGQEKRSLVVDEQKLIIDHRSVDGFFELATDPGELHNLVPSQIFEKGRLGQHLRAIEWRLASRQQTADQVEIDPELRKQLEALGYIN